MNALDISRPFLLAFVIFICLGGAKLIRQSLFSIDEVWKMYQNDSLKKGFAPERDKEWEKRAKSSQIVKRFTGSCLIFTGICFLWVFLRIP